MITDDPHTYTENIYSETKPPWTPLRSDPDSPRPPHHAHTMSHSNVFQAPDFQELNKSSTSYLKTLSKFAQNGDVQEYALSSPASSVTGLHNRRRLKRTDSPRESRARTYGWGDRNWMDKQRQFLQAYEYLCHIGEAKEWIEDIIQQSIPPIVELEEALRDGVTLAEVVQAFRPGQQLRIFRSPKLQYKHSDNIVLFFRFLEEVGLPELFRFELIDLYEKKNIPKVIHCVHALSWLLYRKGMVEFRIGNLVGQLQFQDHELEQTQKGLDKAGVSMPSFSGMGASFGAEPDPVPVETEEDRIDRELQEREATIVELQSQVRAAMVRLKLGHKMNDLWDVEDKITELQAIIRGDFARQISNYKLGMQTFATNVQAAARGFLKRRQQLQKQEFWLSRQHEVLRIQSLFRASRVRTETQRVKLEIRKQHEGIKLIQAAIRGATCRKNTQQQVRATQRSVKETIHLQAVVRGLLARHRLQQEHAALVSCHKSLVPLQAAIRAARVRDRWSYDWHKLAQHSPKWIDLQSRVRGFTLRADQKSLMRQLTSQRQSTIVLQAHLRGANSRTRHYDLLEGLAGANEGTIHLQKVARGFVLRRRLEVQHASLHDKTPGIVLLQGQIRGMHCRGRIGDMLSRLHDHEGEILALQSAVRAVLCRSRVGHLLSELEEGEEEIVLLQAAIRGQKVREKFAEKKRFFRENMEKVVKIQSVIRAKIQGQAYKSLTSGKNPPVGTLKGFVHLLNDSDFDFEEEIEMERLRKTVIQHVRQNEIADQYIQQLEIKIALLVKNKITLDEVVKHQRSFGGNLLTGPGISSRETSDLKGLNKTSRQKLEHYQELIFLLQTQPQYLARLFRHLRVSATADKECDRVKHLVLGIFGYSQKRREEYYLLKLITRAIREEVESCESLADFSRLNMMCTRIFTASTRSTRDRKFHRDVLGALVRVNFVENQHLDLESDPLQIYLSAISNEELRTGRRSQRDPNVPREQAIRDPETRQTFITHMQDLRDITDQFFLSLEDSLHKLPFNIRYVVQQMYDALSEHFPAEDSSVVLQTVGQWIFRHYIQIAFLEPEKSGVTDRSMTQEQKKNLHEVAKVLAQISSGREFGADNVYLQPLNNYVHESAQRFNAIWHRATDIPTAEAHYDIDEFNDLYARTKPTLFIKVADLISMHSLISNAISVIAPNVDDSVRLTLRELGGVKAAEADLTSLSASSEISLTLTPRYIDSADPEADIKALFTETKRCVLYIIRIQTGPSLLDILITPLTTEDEMKWQTLIVDELTLSTQTAKNRHAYADLTNTLDFTTLTYADLKSIALENILQLESIGRLSRHNQYQDLLNMIAIDIRTKHRRRLQRQRELDGVRTTLQRLNEQAGYLESQLKTYNDYIEQAMVTLQSKKKNKKFLLPFTKQWDHERELSRSGRSFKFGSYKYSARNLADKGVLIHWRGYTEQQWYRIDMTISSNEVGVFMVDGSQGNMMIPGASATIQLDELLSAQFENKPWLEYFEGGVLRVSVNLFLHLIMKKFYGE